MSSYSQNPFPHQQCQPPPQSTADDTFAPPAGPPPGWEGRPSSSSGYYPTGSPHNDHHDNAPQQAYTNYQHNIGYLAPYPAQEQQQQRPSSWHGQSNYPPASVPMIYPPAMHCWIYTDSSLAIFVEFGNSPLGEPLFSGKLSMSTGKVTFRQQKFKRNGEHLGEARPKILMSSKYIIKLPSGLEVPYDSSFEFPYQGTNERWVWGGIAGRSLGNKLADKLTQKVTGKEKSVQLTGQTSGIVAATMTAKGGDFSSSITKKPVGLFEFKGPVLSGELGAEFATVALVAFIREKQKDDDEKTLKAFLNAS